MPKKLRSKKHLLAGPDESIYRPTVAQISAKALENNFKIIKSHTGRSVKLIAVVKANAYGHSAVPVSKIALENGAYALGVSSIEEGAALRAGGIKGRILVLGSLFPLENLSVASDYELVPTISSLQGLKSLAKAAAGKKRRLPFHLKVDTGMGRIGVSGESAPRLIDAALSEKGIALEGIYTHFSTADSDPEFTDFQYDLFMKTVEYAKGRGMKFIAHAANSAGIFRSRKYHLDAVRPGISLYGLSPFPGADEAIPLKPALSWKTRIVFIKKVPTGTPVSYGKTYVTSRPSVLATLPAGYADGFSRHLSNNSEVLIRGARCPVRGCVTMDMIMADVTDVPGADIGDEAVLIGSQGAGRITAEEMAQKAGTINYEITCAISGRVPRVMVE
ncbi:MAG: alanine racemase [Endomicrobiales bacterium]|nr:alanine racemase [Endomicrobiales bacterium]